MKTSIAVDDDLVKTAMAATGAKTKVAAVEAALRMLIKVKAQVGIRELWGTVEFESQTHDIAGGRN